MPPKQKPHELLEDEAFLEKLAESLAAFILPKLEKQIIDRLSELNLFNSELSEEFKNFKDEEDKRINKLKCESAKKLDSIEQYARLNSIRVFGVPEAEDEQSEDVSKKICETITSELKIKIAPSDLDISHRLGKKNLQRDNPRPIIVKFLRREDRLKVLQARRKLKGKTVTIHP